MTTVDLDPRQAGSRLPRLSGLGWVTWRQHRMALAAVVAVFGGFGVLMLVDGLSTRHAYAALGLNHCGNLAGPACQLPLGLFQQGYALILPRIPNSSQA